MTLAIGMPQLAAGGLSENWLFRHSGDAHWQSLCASLGVRSADLRDDGGARLYATFVAVSARYSSPLADFRENDALDTATGLAHFGQSFFASKVVVSGSPGRLELDMLTAFAAREDTARNDLRKSVPASNLRFTTPGLTETPQLLKTAQDLRRGTALHHGIGGHRFSLAEPTIGPTMDYDPSPYLDYNGANLLYFAAYPTIADTIERRILRRDGLAPGDRDWALRASTAARDVFYYRNLDLGEPLRGRLRALVLNEREAFLHTTLERGRDGAALADVFTCKRFVEAV